MDSFREKDEVYFVLRAEEDAGEPAVISAAGLLAASLFDGRRSLAEVAALFEKTAGARCPEDDLRSLAERLESLSLLETEAVAASRAERERRFAENPVRLPAHAGGGYPSDPSELSAFLSSFGGSRKAPAAAQPPKGFFAPHIDFHRGGAAYAVSYAELAACAPPDEVVALGVAHRSPPTPWVPTRKAYSTPFGLQSADAGLVEELSAALGVDARDERVHEREHSLEFQAVWLKHLWGDAAPAWAPFLCSSFRLDADRTPASSAKLEKAIRRACDALERRARSGRRILVLAGVDLSHVGPCFGDAFDADPTVRARVEVEDRLSLERAFELDAEGFYRVAASDGEWKKVCGLTAIYTALRFVKALGAAGGRLVTYGQADDPRGGIVSFAGALFA